MVPGAGLEPARLAAQASKTCVAANYTTPAKECLRKYQTRVRHVRFQDQTGVTLALTPLRITRALAAVTVPT